MSFSDFCTDIKQIENVKSPETKLITDTCMTLTVTAYVFRRQMQSVISENVSQSLHASWADFRTSSEGRSVSCSVESLPTMAINLCKPITQVLRSRTMQYALSFSHKIRLMLYEQRKVTFLLASIANKILQKLLIDRLISLKGLFAVWQLCVGA